MNAIELLQRKAALFRQEAELLRAEAREYDRKACGIDGQLSPTETAEIAAISRELTVKIQAATIEALQKVAGP